MKGPYGARDNKVMQSLTKETDYFVAIATRNYLENET
jgi:hypothetical protein